MRLGYLIPVFVAGALALSGCGGEAPAPAGPAVPAADVTPEHLQMRVQALRGDWQ